MNEIDELRFQLETERQQCTIWRGEVERLKAMRLCKFCVCKNYHAAGCNCTVRV